MPHAGHRTKRWLCGAPGFDNLIGTDPSPWMLEHRKAGAFEFIEGSYSQTRTHSSLGYESLVDYEKSKMKGTTVT